MQPDDADDAALEQAFDLLAEGRYEDLLGLLAERSRSGADEPLANLLAVHAHLGLGRLDAAAAALQRVEGQVPADDPELLRARGELRLAGWRLEEARDAYRTLCRLDPDADDWLRLGLCEDLLEEASAAERALERARRLDPEGMGGMRHHPPELFEEIVERAARTLPADLHAELEHTPVVIDPVPRRELARGREAETPPDLLGLFLGHSHLERSVEAGGEVPAVIYLFQRNLERSCSDLETLEEQIAITLFHELGHLLGFDEEGVDALGLA
jgi:predicted Zn-dependent protease with MMP-like domain